MKSSLTWCALLLTVASCRSAVPYRPVDPWVTLEHNPGYEIVPGFLGRIAGQAVPQASWKLRIGKDGRVERDQVTACQWETIPLRALREDELSALRSEIQKLVLPMVSGRPVEDDARDVLILGDRSEGVAIEVWNPYARGEHQGIEQFFKIWDRMTTLFPPPKARRVSCW